MREHKIMELTPEVLESYWGHLMDEERSRAMVEKYSRDARKSLEYLRDDGGMDKEKVWEFKQKLMKYYKISSVNSMLAAVNSFPGFVRRGGLKMELLKIQKAVYNRPEREMTEKGYEGLAWTAKRLGDLRMDMLLQTIDSTGIRISELKFITVEPLEAGRAEIYNRGELRVILLPVELIRLLRRCCRKTGIHAGSIFITRQGNPLNRNNVSKKMEQPGREVGVDVAKVFPHSLRHLPARIFCSIEEDVVRLMDLLGHSSISTTRIYAMATEEQPRRQMSWMKLVFG